MNEMNIASAQYLDPDGDGTNDTIKATIDGVVMVIPLAPGNRHYDEIQRQVAAGPLAIQDAD